MSVDDRLRDAFRSDEPPEHDIVHTLGVVRAAERQERVLRRQVLGAVAVAASIAIVLVLVLGRGEPRAVGPVEEPTPTPTAVISVDPADVLHGSWRSSALTAGGLRRTLEDAGLGRWHGNVVDDLPVVPVTLVLSVQGHLWTLTAEMGDDDLVLDQETVAADGRRLVISPKFAVGSSTYDYVIRIGPAGRRLLALRFVETTEGRSHGVPGEAFQRALYTTTAFREQPE